MKIIRNLITIKCTALLSRNGVICNVCIGEFRLPLEAVQVWCSNDSVLIYVQHGNNYVKCVFFEFCLPHEWNCTFFRSFRFSFFLSLSLDETAVAALKAIAQCNKTVSHVCTWMQMKCFAFTLPSVEAMRHETLMDCVSMPFRKRRRRRSHEIIVIIAYGVMVLLSRTLPENPLDGERNERQEHGSVLCERPIAVSSECLNMLVARTLSVG